MTATDWRLIFHAHQQSPLPKIDMLRSKLEGWQDLFSMAGVLACSVAFIFRPPGTSPCAFMLVAFSILMLIAITLIQRCLHEFNYVVTITPENAEYHYRHARELLGWVKVETLWLFLVM